METKEFKKAIKGKNGYTSTICIQKHLPSSKMIFIVLSNNNSIFCQDNHPVIINSFNKSKKIAASDIKHTDKIWFDNNIVYNHESIIPIKEEEILGLTHYLKECLEGKETNLNKYSIFKGDKITNFRFEPNFINYSIEWLKTFIDELLSKIMNYNIIFKSKSPILIQQLKFICDRIDYYSEISYTTSSGNFFCINICNNLPSRNKHISGLCEVARIYRDIEWNDYVYDVKTETGNFMLSCTETSNSFHTGGSVILSRVKILDLIMETLSEDNRMFVENIFSQEFDDLILKTGICKIRIDKTIFTDKYKIVENNAGYMLPLGYCTVILDNDVEIPLNIEQPTIIIKHPGNKIQNIDETVIVTFTEGQKIMTVKPIAMEPEKIAGALDTLLGGKSPWTTPESFYLKAYKTLGHFDNWDSVHLEVIMSNILRNRKEPQIPARLKEPYDAISVSVKSLPSLVSWPLGLSFENVGKSLSLGLISDRSVPSEIEKVLFGEPLSDLSKQQIKDLRKKK